jgi:hypothetical protein
MTLASRAADHQAAQRALSARLIEQMGPLWDLIRLGAFATTVPLWIAAVVELLQRFARMSGTLAADYYAEERDIANARGVFVPAPAQIPDGKAEASLRWATKSLWVPEADNPPPIEERLASAEHLAEGVAQKIVADVGRDTVMEALEDDPEAVAWARQTDADPCAFCALMSSRGAVFHTEETAGRAANRRFIGAGEYKFHNFCSCTVIPILEGQRWEPPEYVQEWDRLYTEVTGGVRGREDKLRAWRRAFEGRGEETPS